MSTVQNRTSERKGTAVVTGASSGIGRVYAERLARQGYDLHLVARRGDRLQQLPEELIGKFGVGVRMTAADLSRPDELTAVVDSVQADTTLTMLVNNAGISNMQPIADTNPGKSEAIIALNITALTRLTIAALAGFRVRNRGTIVNIGSAVAFGIYPTVGIYSASKAYVFSFTRTLQAELQDTNIVVQLVTPAATVSEGWERAGGSLEGVDPAWVMSTENMVDAALQGLAMGEKVTVPPVEDASLVTGLIDAGHAVFMAAKTGKPASRYRVDA